MSDYRIPGIGGSTNLPGLKGSEGVKKAEVLIEYGREPPILPELKLPEGAYMVAPWKNLEERSGSQEDESAKEKTSEIEAGENELRVSTLKLQVEEAELKIAQLRREREALRKKDVLDETKGGNEKQPKVHELQTQKVGLTAKDRPVSEFSGIAPKGVPAYNDELWSKVVLYQFWYSIGGLFLGVLTIIGGLILFIRGVTGATNWTASLWGFNSKVADAAPGAILFIVGIFLVRITRFSVRGRGVPTH